MLVFLIYFYISVPFLSFCSFSKNIHVTCALELRKDGLNLFFKMVMQLSCCRRLTMSPLQNFKGLLVVLCRGSPDMLTRYDLLQIVACRVPGTD